MVEDFLKPIKGYMTPFQFLELGHNILYLYTKAPIHQLITFIFRHWWDMDHMVKQLTMNRQMQ